MDNDNSQGQPNVPDQTMGKPDSEGTELKKLEEELKTINSQGVGSFPQGDLNMQGTPTTPIPAAPVASPPPLPIQEPMNAVPPQGENPPVNTEHKSSKILMMAIGFLVLSVVALGAYFLGNGGSAQKACTEDAKLCSDGSSVVRGGPNCEFAPCPVYTALPSPSPTETSSPTPSGSASATPTATPSASSSASPSVIPTATP